MAGVENKLVGCNWTHPLLVALLVEAFLLLILNITSQGYGPSYLFSFLVILIFVCAMISLGGMVVSIVVVMNWHINKFDIRTPSMICKLCYLGYCNCI